MFPPVLFTAVFPSTVQGQAMDMPTELFDAVLPITVELAPTRIPIHPVIPLFFVAVLPFTMESGPTLSPVKLSLTALLQTMEPEPTSPAPPKQSEM